MISRYIAWLAILVRTACVQGLFCTFIAPTAAGMDTASHIADSVPPRVFTVANVFVDPATPDYATVAFFESARYYKLLRSNRHYSASLSLLQQAKQNKKPVQVYLTEAFGDVIDRVGPIKKRKKG
jgi:hypothetical protein